MIDLNQHTLELDYPCNWKYKLVMRQEIDIKIVLKETLGDREYNVSLSNASKKGKFNSHKVELLVHNEDDRKELHRIFHQHKDIKMIV
jgi:uncharacterized protein